jgi:hypothetical protein
MLTYNKSLIFFYIKLSASIKTTSHFFAFFEFVINFVWVAVLTTVCEVG